jgi:hypothetical protein
LSCFGSAPKHRADGVASQSLRVPAARIVNDYDETGQPLRCAALLECRAHRAVRTPEALADGREAWLEDQRKEPNHDQ